jgi:hypothetical protein
VDAPVSVDRAARGGKGKVALGRERGDGVAHLRPDEREAQRRGIVDLRRGAAAAVRWRRGRVGGGGGAQGRERARRVWQVRRSAQSWGRARAIQARRLACHALPTLTVMKASLPRHCTAKGTSVVMYPSARKGVNRGWCPGRASLIACELRRRPRGELLGDGCWTMVLKCTIWHSGMTN